MTALETDGTDRQTDRHTRPLSLGHYGRKQRNKRQSSPSFLQKLWKQRRFMSS